MYEKFYGFTERPFSLLPDPDFLFLGKKHRTALDLLELAIFNRSGFCAISGEIGAGKTTLIRELLNRLDATICVGLVSNARPSFSELMEWIMAAYGLNCGSDDQLELQKRFIDFIIQQYAENKHTLLIIDEAQNLSVSALEELRMLSNINSDKDQVLQIILVGQQQLRDRLKKPELEQFAQRIALDYHLNGLSREETGQYIQHRVAHAGGAPDLFSQAACEAVFDISDGIPRVINRICDLSLVYGYSEETPVVTAAIVDRVIECQHMGSLLKSASIPAAQPSAGRVDPRTVQQAIHDNLGAGRNVDIAQTEVAAAPGFANAAETMPAEDNKSLQSSIEVPAPIDDEHCAGERENSFSHSLSDDQPDARGNHRHLRKEETPGIAATAEQTANQHSTISDAGVSSVENNHGESAHREDKSIDPSNSTSDTGAASTDPLPRPEKKSGLKKKLAEADGSRRTSSIHKLVVAAEQNQNRQTKSERGALWLLIGVVAMGSMTGWMTRELWSPLLWGEVAAVKAEQLPKFMPEEAVTSLSQAGLKATPSRTGRSDPVPDSVRVSPDPDGKVAHQPPAAETQPRARRADAHAEQTTEIEAPQARSGPSDAVGVAEKPLPAVEPVPEHVRMVEKQDSDAVPARPVTQPLVHTARHETDLREEAERLARLQKESERLERERRVAEDKLAGQRKARQELERKMRLERERIVAARKAVEQVAEDRARVEIQLSTVPRPEPPVRPPEQDSGTRQTVAARSEEQNVAPEHPRKPGAVATPSPAFSSNPCNGPTARFMSTCR